MKKASTSRPLQKSSPPRAFDSAALTRKAHGLLDALRSAVNLLWVSDGLASIRASSAVRARADQLRWEILDTVPVHGGSPVKCFVLRGENPENPEETTVRVGRVPVIGPGQRFDAVAELLEITDAILHGADPVTRNSLSQDLPSLERSMARVENALGLLAEGQETKIPAETNPPTETRPLSEIEVQILRVLSAKQPQAARAIAIEIHRSEGRVRHVLADMKKRRMILHKRDAGYTLPPTC